MHMSVTQQKWSITPVADLSLTRHSVQTPMIRAFVITSLTLVLSFLSFGLSAQTDSLKKALGELNTAGNVRNTGSNEVNVVADSLIVKLEKGSRKYKDVKGFRIQIFLGSHDQINSERNKYLSLGLPYSAHIKQIVPEQALQVGDFMTRMEMEKHLEIIKKYYPKAFGVVEVIEPPRFSGKK
jgi:hypothetical protein